MLAAAVWLTEGYEHGERRGGGHNKTTRTNPKDVEDQAMKASVANVVSLSAIFSRINAMFSGGLAMRLASNARKAHMKILELTELKKSR